MRRHGRELSPRCSGLWRRNERVATLTLESQSWEAPISQTPTLSPRL